MRRFENVKKEKEEEIFKTFLQGLNEEDFKKIDLGLNFIGYTVEELESIQNKDTALEIMKRMTAEDSMKMKKIYDIAKTELISLFPTKNSQENTTSPTPESQEEKPLEIQEQKELPAEIQKQLEEMNESEDGSEIIKQYINSLNTESLVKIDYAINFINENFLSLAISEDPIRTKELLEEIVKNGQTNELLSDLDSSINDELRHAVNQN